MLHCRRPMVAQASSLYSGRALQAGYATLPATNGSIGFQPVFRARPTSRICYTAGVPGSDGASPYRAPWKDKPL